MQLVGVLISQTYHLTKKKKKKKLFPLFFSFPFTSLMYDYQDQPQPTRRKKSRRRQPSTTRSQPDYYDGYDDGDDYTHWSQLPAAPPPSASSGYMPLPPYPYGVPDDLDLYMDAMNLYSPKGDTDDYDDYALPHHYHPPPPPPHHYPPHYDDPMMFDNFYDPMLLSRQSSSRRTEPYLHPEIPTDDHLMMMEEDGMMEDNWYSPIRPDLVQHKPRRKSKRLQRSHSIATTAPQHYQDASDMYFYPMGQHDPYQQSISAPNSPGNRRFNDGGDDRLPGLQRSTSMQMMDGPQRRHSFYKPNDQPTSDYMGPVAHSAPGTPWMSPMEPTSHRPPGVLPASMPSSSSLKAPTRSTLEHSNISGGGLGLGLGGGGGLDLGGLGGGSDYFPRQQQQQQAMMMQQGGGGMNMPLPTPPMMGMPPFMGPRPPPMWNSNDMMGPWDPMMMGPMGPRPPPFGFGDPMMMMNPMMNGPMGPMGMMSGPHEDTNNHGGGKKSTNKEDKKTNKDNTKSTDDTKEVATKSKEPVSITEAAEASKATTTSTSNTAAERQLPPLNEQGTMVRRKPSIWNLFGIGGKNSNQSMMMPTPYGMPSRLPYMPPSDMMMMMTDLHHGEHPKLAEMVEKFQQLMYVWCYVTPTENFQTAWCTFKIQNQRKLNHADRHGHRAVTLDKEKGLPGTVIVNPLSKTAVMYKSLWSTTKMIITIMRLPQEEYRRQQHALSPELMRRWGSKQRNPGYTTNVFNSMFRDYPR
ncbi:hypothetical protein BC941DRAFT_153996 [Chlamydoabsidia padenii]|nr:hypothetical protein BC941DRAFT_153996 [Chlamydoabsidia padenii]